MNPVYQMPAVEVVRHREIGEGTLNLTLETAARPGQEPVRGQRRDRLLGQQAPGAVHARGLPGLERGEITVEDGDSGLKGSLGHPQGVFKLSDFIGSDTMYRVAMAMYLATQDPRYYPPAILTRMFKNNELGVKTGKGFYEWDGFKPVKGRDFSEITIQSSDTLLEV